MRTRGLILMLGLVLTISVLFSACSKKTNDEQKESAETEKAETVETAANEKAENSEATEPEKTETQEATEPEKTETQEATEPEKTETSETAEDDFSIYYDVDYKPYFKAAEKQGVLEQITYHSEVMGADRTALVYKPAGFPMNAKYPVIVLIHGLGCDENQWTSMSACDALDHMIEEGIIRPCVAVFPSVVPADGLDPNGMSAANIGAFSYFEEEWKQDLWPYLSSHYPLLDNREAHAVCGLSMGGMEALRLGFTQLDFFDYIGSFSAAPSLDTSVLTTEGSDYEPSLVIICTGDRDTTVGDNPYNYYKTLTDNGVDCIWYLHPGEAHTPNAWRVGLYNFLIRLDGNFKGKK